MTAVMRALVESELDRCGVCGLPADDTVVLEVCNDCMDDFEQVAYVRAHPGLSGWRRRVEVALVVALAWALWFVPLGLYLALS